MGTGLEDASGSTGQAAADRPAPRTGPLDAWLKFHQQYGTLETTDDSKGGATVLLVSVLA
jgi:hypothetical protein